MFCHRFTTTAMKNLKDFAPSNYKTILIIMVIIILIAGLFIAYFQFSKQ